MDKKDNIEELEGTVRVNFDQEKAEINRLENTFVEEEGKGVDKDVSD